MNLLSEWLIYESIVRIKLKNNIISKILVKEKLSSLNGEKLARAKKLNKKLKVWGLSEVNLLLSLVSQ